MKFEPGMVVATANAVNKVRGADLQECLVRHLNGDWGDSEDADMNEEGLNPETQDRLMSVYKLDYITVWVITEEDRSATTVLLPEDY